MAARKVKKFEKAFLRGVDANANRAKEALRVTEDIARFLIEDKNATKRLKQCRHGLTQALLKFPLNYREFLAARNATGDIGKKSAIQDLRGKPKWQDLMSSNFKRAQEATRVLEEFSKTLSPKQSKDFQKIRFSLYELEKRCLS